MTTRVTVDAHAGWPVKVECIDDVFEGGAKTGEKITAMMTIVPPYRTEDFHCHDSRSLIITEMPRDV